MLVSLEPIGRERRIEVTKELDQAGSMSTDEEHVYGRNKLQRPYLTSRVASSK